MTQLVLYPPESSPYSIRMRLAQVFLYPTAVDTSEAAGQATVEVDLSAAGVVSGEAAGVAALELDLAAAGAASAESVGQASIDLAVAAAGIGSAEALDAAAVEMDLAAAGVSSAEAAGQASLEVDLAASGEAVGAASVAETVAAAGVASVEAEGAAGLEVVLAATGVESAEALGQAVVVAPALLSAVGVASGEAVGAAVVRLAPQPVVAARREAALVSVERYAGPLYGTTRRPMAQSFFANTRVRFSVEFTGVTAGAPLDPSVVRFRMSPRSAPRVLCHDLVYGRDEDLVRDGAGKYHVDALLTYVGPTDVAWISSADGQEVVDEWTIDVRKSTLA